jgi:hypothetical protein
VIVGITAGKFISAIYVSLTERKKGLTLLSTSHRIVCSTKRKRLQKEASELLGFRVIIL